MFTDHGMPAGLHTVTIIEQLKALPESPWADLYGTGLHDRGLATILSRYEVASRSVRVGDFSRKGYTVDDLWQPWSRYCPNVPPQEGSQGSQPEPNQDHVTLVTPNGRQRTDSCAVCGLPIDPTLAALGDTTHPGCEDPL